jgi:branched-chain amino acid transport system substrate-binding protein
MVCSCTGAAAPQYVGVQGAFQARIRLQNAMGGINGRRVVGIVEDDATNPAQTPIAVQDAISKGAVGIVAVDALFFEGAKYATQDHIPVTGSSSDGPEWGEQPYTNMFASDVGSVDPRYPANTLLGKFLVSHGGTTVASYGVGIAPLSVRAATSVIQSVVHAGGKKGVLDTSVPFGSENFTAAALTAKSHHVTGLTTAMADNSNFALVTAMKQAGVNLKAVVLPTGYEPDAITSPVWTDLQGDYFFSEFRPFSVPNAGTLQMQAALKKYAGFTSTDFPNFIQYEAWLGADLMIKGIQLAGKNPTSTNVITKLRGVKSYNGNGILPTSINYSTVFGHSANPQCGWFLQAKPKGFVPLQNSLQCGTLIPGSGQSAAS